MDGHARGPGNSAGVVSKTQPTNVRYSEVKRVVTIGLSIWLVWALLLPAMAGGNSDGVPTSVSIYGGSSNPPIVKAMWQQDLTPSLEDGDPLHVKYVGDPSLNNSPANSQFLPPMVKGGKKPIRYWAIVTDPDGIETILHGWSVTVNVSYPSGSPRKGTSKYELILQPVDFATGKAAYIAARNARLVTYQQNTTPPTTDADVLFELDKQTSAVWMVQGELDYEQPAGDYKTVIDAFDNSNTWASQGTPKTNLENLFTYVGVGGIVLDFNALNHGSVTVNSEKWITGATIWNTLSAAEPIPNPATVRSIGNTLMKITIKNTDMGFGFNGVTPTTYSRSMPLPAGLSNWNVVFAAEMGSNTANAMYFDPNVTVTTPNILRLYSQDELVFSTNVHKSPGRSHAGSMWLGAAITPW